MNYKCKILPQAKKDIREAARYYNQQQNNLGLRFLKEVDSKVTTICRHPGAYQVRYRQVRMALLKKFPHSIHYLIDEEIKQIFIIAVFHHAQDPAKWTKG